MFGRQSATAVDPDDKATDDRTGVITSNRAVDDMVDDDRDTVTRPATTADPMAESERDEERERVVEPREAKRWAHVSALASLTLVVGVLAVAATMTGLLAPIGFAAGVLAVLLGAVATYSITRPNVTGHGLVVFGVLFGVAAIVLSLLAINGQLSWLSNNTNEITNLHNWLNDHMHWLRRW
jgi:1,4-dihydroxy-2-naphthoate octaprenyltransferase